jgi:hypothetical protein
MALSKHVEVAHAKRVLKRMVEDAPLFRVRIACFSPEAQAIAVRHFESALLEKKAIIMDLEAH